MADPNIELLEVPHKDPRYPLALVAVEGKTFAVCNEGNIAGQIQAFYKCELKEDRKNHIQIRKRSPKKSYIYMYMWESTQFTKKYFSYYGLRRFIKKNINYFQCTDDPSIWQPIRLLVDQSPHSGLNMKMPGLDDIEKFMFFLDGKPFIWTKWTPGPDLLFPIGCSFLVVRKYLHFEDTLEGGQECQTCKISNC
jgi:hypothetical protein